MKNIFKISLILCLPMLAWAIGPKKDGKYKEEKTIKKEFSVNSNATLEIDNQFGTVDIATWNENRVVIEVTIKTTGDKQDEVKQRLDDIKIFFDNSPSYVKAETKIGKAKGSKWKWKEVWNGRKNKCTSTMEINYKVRMPVNNSLNLSNDFGVFAIDELNGNLKLDSDHSQLLIGRLNGSDNRLSFDFGNNSSIEYLASGVIDADHSIYTIDRANVLYVDGDFSTAHLNTIGKLEFDSDHAKFTIDKIDSIDADGDFTVVTVNQLKEGLALDGDHAKLFIDKVENSCKKIDVQGDFTLLKLGNLRDHNFSFLIDMENGKAKGLEKLNVTKKVVDGMEIRIEGTQGSRSNNNLIFISEFGQIIFGNE